jgi:Endonuclease/Exonuclease/phosphatase family
MLNFLFWNVNGKDDLIAEIVREKAVDVLLLAENVASAGEIVAKIEAAGGGRFHDDPSCEGETAIFTRFPRQHVSIELDEHNFAIRRLRTVPKDILIVLVHLRSKLYANENEQEARSRSKASQIRAVEKTIGHQRTVLVGDLNMDPFDSGMIGASAFHAIMCRNVAGRRERVFDNQPYPFFYNPMWNLLGDQTAPPGTYYYDNGDHASLYWHMYDQVLLRPDALPYFELEKLRIITECDASDLTNNNGRPDKAISDHFPIFFQLNLDLPGARHGQI